MSIDTDPQLYIYDKIREEPENALLLAAWNTSGDKVTERLIAMNDWLIEYGEPKDSPEFFKWQPAPPTVNNARTQLAKLAHKLGCNHPDFDYD